MESISKILIGPAGVILIGAIIVAIGGFWAEIQNNEIQNELKEKTAKTSELNEYIAASVTGGETYPYVRVTFPHTPRGLVNFNLMSDGENPLYDLGMNIIDNDKYKFKDDAAYEKYQQNLNKGIDEGRKSISIGNFRPHEVRMIAGFMMEEDRAERNFTIELIARNGYFRQQIKVVRQDGKFKVESEVKKGDEILKKL